MRIVFMGTPDFATPALRAILAEGHAVVAVYTRAPKPAGRRGLETKRSAVHELADLHGLPVLTPTSLRSPEAQAAFRGHDADVALVAAYGLLLPPAVLAAPRLGCLNLHASLLPRWRGAAPIHRAVMAGDPLGGVTVMQMEEGLDTGPMLLPRGETPIGLDETTGELHDRLADLGARLAVEALAALAAGPLVFTQQPSDGVVYAQKIDKSERDIDWTKPAAQVHNAIRGLSPYPGATFVFDFGRGPEQVKVLRSRRKDDARPGAAAPGEVLDDALTVACGEGAVQLLELQRPGRGRLSAREFLSGARVPPGALLR